MNQKVDRVCSELIDTVSSWDSVQAISMMDFLSDETFDPYFFISIDVYFNGGLPDFEERKKIFPDAIAFEASRARQKDRFLIRDLPVRLEYKQMLQINDMVTAYTSYEDRFRYNGTYGLYRLQNGHVRYDPDGWFSKMREKLEALDNDFWRFLFTIFRGTTEHFFGDLHAATIKGDQYFFTISSAGFIQNVVRLLFAVNRRFECSGRQVFRAVYDLEALPEGFSGRFESFLRNDGQLSLEKKREVAELLVTSIIDMEYMLV